VYCLSGGESSGVIFEAILDGTPISVVRFNPGVPLKLEELINKCLEKDRELRYQSAAEMRADLKRLRRDTDSGRIGSSVSTRVLESIVNSRTQSATAAQPSVGLRAKLYAVLSACIALLGASFA
jgi:eukaryotic-like serine/threonine-protein kinase